MQDTLTNQRLSVETWLHQLEQITGLPPKRSGNGWSARCPAHEDHNPSLSVSEGTDGKPLVCCHAGCSYPDICRALGMDASKAPAAPQITYDYRDESGALLFQVVRQVPKAFRQRQPDGNGGWVWKMEGVRRVPYRLPELLGAVPFEWVFICEGEKDADRLAALGFTATTCPGGAGKWRSEFNQHFKGLRVAVLPDNDEPGRQHAEKVAKALSAVAVEVRVVTLPNLPEKGDVSDWLASGGAAEELDRLVDEAPAWEAESCEGWRVRKYCLADVESESVRFLWEPYLPLGKVTLLEGNPNLGKTFLWLTIAAAVSRGGRLPGQSGELDQSIPMGNTVLLTAEDGLADTIRPRLEKLDGDPARVTAFDCLEGKQGAERTITLADLDALRSELRRLAPSLVVFDPLQAFLGPNVNMNAANEVRPLMQALGRLAEELDCAVLCVRHLRKSAADHAVHRGLGSIDISAAVRSQLQVGLHPDNPDQRVLTHSKNNLTPRGTSQVYEIDGAGLHWRGKTELGAEDIAGPVASRDERDARGEAMDFLVGILSDGPRPCTEIMAEAKQLEISDRTLRRAKSELGVRSRQQVGGEGKRCHYWCLDADTQTVGHLAACPETASLSDQVADSPTLPGCQAGGCSRCGESNFWRSIYGEKKCGTCHPPASNSLVAHWLPEGQGHE